jgi:hypothetical protein
VGGVRSSAVETRALGVGSLAVTDQQSMILGSLFAAAPAFPAAKTTPSGLVIPNLSWTAARLGLVPVRDAWLDSAVSAYLTASEYLGPWEQAQGNVFDPSVWVDALLRLYPSEVYIEALAALNRAARFKDPALEYQQRFLERLAPVLRAAVASAVVGGVDGRPRWFVARQPVLRAMRLVLTSPDPQGEPDPRIAAVLVGADHLTAAVMLVHLAADGLSQQRPEGEARFGGTGESLAIEMICNQIFNEPHDAGGMVSRTWALWTRYGAALKRAKLSKAPPGVAQGCHWA